MFKRISLASLLAFSVVVSGQAFAQAPANPAAAKPAAAKPAAAKPAAAKPAAAKTAKAQKAAAVKVPKGKLMIDNRRNTELSELSLQPAGAKAGTEPTIVAKALAAGQKITVALPAKAGCVFNINGTFDDESTLDVPASDLCKDPVITLVE